MARVDLQLYMSPRAGRSLESPGFATSRACGRRRLDMAFEDRWRIRRA